MIPKGSRAFLIFVSVCNMFLLGAFLGMVAGVWVVDTEDSFTFTRAFFLQFCLYILNGVSLQRLLFPEKRKDLPLSGKSELVILVLLLLVTFVLQDRFAVRPDSPFWVWLLPSVLFSTLWFILILVGLYKASRLKKHGPES